MPPIPTIQNGNESERPVRPQDRKSDIICRVKYSNTLPDIPFDLKFLTVPFDSDRFTKYNPTTLERNYKFEVLTEHDLGVTIDLINRDLYQPDRNAMHLDPADEKLLEEDTHTPQDTTRSRHHAKSVSWLRKSEYISTEQTRFQPQNMEKAEAKVGYNVKNALREETLYMDRDQQITSIEATFTESKIEVTQHYCKPNVTPVEIFPIYPDFKNWKFPFAQVMFDADPSPSGKSLPNQMEEMSQAMIRGVMDESGEQFVAYFLPTDDTLEKRRTDFSMERPYEDETEYEYKMAREYNWNVKSKLSKGYEENYFLIIREDGVFYNELETRVRLSKRRQKTGAPPSNTKLVVRHRPLNAAEHKMQVMRERQLEPAGEDEEASADEDEELADEKASDEPMDTKTAEDNSGKKRLSKSRSASRSKSRSHSRSRSRSKSGSGSERHSGSRSRSGSHSSSDNSEKNDKKRTSKSRSPSRSKSRSHSRSKSRSKSGSGSERHSRSRSRSGSHSSSGKSRSRSPHSNRSGTGSRSGSHSSASGSGSD